MIKQQTAKAGRILAMIEIARPATTLKAAPYALLGAYLSGTATSLLSFRPWLAMLVVCIVVAFGFVINDFRDVAVDALSKPTRPIPSGRITRRDTATLALALAIVALAIAAGLGLGLGLGIYTVCAIGLSSLYSYLLKGIPFLGNATVALLDASIVVFGSFAARGPTRAVIVVATLTFLYILAFEILHNVADLE